MRALPMMSHGQYHQTVVPILIHETVGELGQHEPTNTLRYLRSGIRVLSDSDEPRVDLVREDRPQTGLSRS